MGSGCGLKLAAVWLEYLISLVGVYFGTNINHFSGGPGGKGGGWVVANVARNGFPCERVVVGSAGRHGP